MKERKPLFPEYIWMFFVGLLLAIIVCMRLLPGHAETLDDSYFIYINPLDANYYKCHGSFGANNYSPEDSTFDAYYMKPYNSNTWSPVNGVTFSNSSVVKDFIVSGEFYVPDSWNSRTHNSVYVPDNWAINTIAVPYPSNYWNYDYHLIYMSGSNMICALSTKPIYVKNKDDSTIYQGYVPLPQTDQFIYMLQWNGSNWSDLGTATFNDTSISDLHGIDTLYAGYINFGNWVYNTVLGIDIYTDNYAIIESEGSLPTFDILASEFEASSDIEVDPEPTPEPEAELAEFIFKYSYTKNGTPEFYLVSIECSNFGIDVDLILTDQISQVMSNYSLGQAVASIPTFVSRANSSGSNFFNFYFTADSVSSVKVYSLGSSLDSNDYDVLKANYSYSELSPLLSDSASNTVIGSYRVNSVNSNVFCYSSMHSAFSSAYAYYSFISTNNIDSYVNYVGSSGLSVTGLFFNDSSSSTSEPSYLGFAGLMGASEPSEPSPTPTPDGWVPTETPTPTPTPPTVIIQWPTSTPSPTPLGIINVNIPTLPIGDLPGVLTENYLDDTVRTINTNAQFGLLSKALSFFPDELMYILWLFIFILLILAVIKLIIHFGG